MNVLDESFLPAEKEGLSEEFQMDYASKRDWRARLEKSRAAGLGFAAPGGEFTRALFEVVASGLADDFKSLLSGQRVVELGAGMMPYGYALSSICGAKNYLGVEPFYADVLTRSIVEFVSVPSAFPRIPFKVVEKDMLIHLQEEADELVSVLACGIENCILPGFAYKEKVEREIFRVLHQGGVFVSSHSDLDPKELHVAEQWFRRLSNPTVQDRVRIYRKG